MLKKPVDECFMKNSIIFPIVYGYYDLLYEVCQIQTENISKICNLARSKAIENDYNQPIL